VISLDVFIAEGRNSSGHLFSVIPLFIFGGIGAILVFNVRGACGAFMRLIAVFMPGVAKTDELRIFRIVGAGVMFLSLVGLIANFVSIFK
jgi:hypothetical protein